MNLGRTLPDTLLIRSNLLCRAFTTLVAPDAAWSLHRARLAHAGWATAMLGIATADSKAKACYNIVICARLSDVS
eukprot:6177323-Pleurochrysis_carterae.AAC.5